MQNAIYLDAQGTERPRPEAISVIHQCLTDDFGNPSATAHRTGQRSLSILETARQSIADILNAPEDGIIFCSGATEANNLALRSFFREGTTLATSAIEHKSVLDPGQAISESFEASTFEIIRVQQNGIVDLNDLKRILEGPVSIVSVMHANNEVGTVQPIVEIAEMCRDAGALLHVDAAQTIGKIPVDFMALGADILTVSGHKFGGPVGSGALILRPELVGKIKPMIIGGGQESGLRAGTVPVAMIAGMSAGLVAAHQAMAAEITQTLRRRDMLISGLSEIPGFFINGDLEQRLPCNFSGGFLGQDASRIMRGIPDVHISVGSACTTGQATSHVLTAMGLSNDHKRSTMRISLSWATTDGEIAALVAKLRAFAMAQTAPRLVA